MSDTSIPPSANPEVGLVNLAYESLDHLMVLVAEGWRSVRLRRGPVGDGLKIVEISTVSGDLPYRPVPRGLGIDPRARTDWLSGHLDRIQEGLLKEGLVWDGLNVVFERTRDDEAAPVDMRFVTPVGSPVANIVIEAPATECIITPRLLDTVTAEWPTWRQRQSAWINAHGEQAGFRFDTKNRLVQVRFESGDVRVYDAELIGSWSKPMGTWCWGWANSGYDPNHVARVAAVRDSDASEGIGALRFPGFQCEEGFARAVASLAASRIGDFPVFEPFVDKANLRLFIGLVSELDASRE